MHPAAGSAPANLLAMAILFHRKSRQTHQHRMKVAALDMANTWSLGTPTSGFMKFNFGACEVQFFQRKMT